MNYSILLNPITLILLIHVTNKGNVAQLLPLEQYRIKVSWFLGTVLHKGEMWLLIAPKSKKESKISKKSLTSVGISWNGEQRKTAFYFVSSHSSCLIKLPSSSLEDLVCSVVHNAVTSEQQTALQTAVCQSSHLPPVVLSLGAEEGWETFVNPIWDGVENIC